MKIPVELVDRETLYNEVVKVCTRSQVDRANDYAILRQYYLFGGQGGVGASPFNKIFPHIDLLTSFLYASETTKFMTHLGASAKEHEYARVPVLSRSINDRWLDSNADRVASNAITWSLVYNSTLVKMIFKVDESTGKVQIHPFMIHPASFGVYREDISFTDRQEAMTHTYYTTKSQLEIDLADHPQKAAILASVESGSATEKLEEEKQDGIARLMMGTQQPLVAGTTAVGNVEFSFESTMDYLPDTDEKELVTLVELWIWDTTEKDYRIVTRIKDGMTVYDRIASHHQIFLPGEHPFIQFCPSPLPFYLWGMSEVAGLANLQEWYNERILQIRKLLNLQVKPPTDAFGFGALDENAYALFSEGGLLAPQDPSQINAKLQRHPPQLPEDLFTVLREIDQAFSDHSGLPNTVQGKGEVGVRSGKQTDQLARLGSARIKKRALVIEDALEKMATLYLKIMKKYDNTTYVDDKGVSFTADQFTVDFVVKVDGHSNSPIFVEDKKELAFSMLEQHMITRSRAVEMIDPPDKEIMKRELKDIEAAEQKAAQQQMQAEAGGGRTA